MQFSAFLPVPPTANNLFPTSKSGHRFPSKQYKAWAGLAEKWFAIDAPAAVPCLKGRIRARYEFAFGDRRARDIANFEKAVTDFLVKKRVLLDDCQIDEFQLVRKSTGEDSYVFAVLEEI